MTRAILVTHALTRWNVENRIQGHTDVPLSPEGRVMALALARRLGNEPVHAVYASDLSRAVQTAEPLARQKALAVIRDMRLREGRSVFQERSEQYPTLPFPVETEIEDQVLERMTRAMGDIGESHPGQTVLVVSHGAAVEIFISHLLSEAAESSMVYRNIRMALNRLAYEDGHWHCLDLNDAQHLADLHDQQ